MSRAHRYFIPNQVWHITHRCHKQEFLLRFARDRKCWLHWLFEAKKRYGLCVLNYTVTSNHIHLLVYDTGNNVIAKSMQLIAGRTAQEYNQRKKRKGAYWEDRYHATAVDAQEYLMKCLVYIDLNMVRTGAIKYPGDWKQSGYNEIQNPPERYAIIDLKKLVELTGFGSLEHFQQAHIRWVKNEIDSGCTKREAKWTKSLAVGSEAYINNVYATFGLKVKYRTKTGAENEYQIKEAEVPYSIDFGAENGILRRNAEYFWDKI